MRGTFEVQLQTSTTPLHAVLNSFHTLFSLLLTSQGSAHIPRCWAFVPWHMLFSALPTELLLILQDLGQICPLPLPPQGQSELFHPLGAHLYGNILRRPQL